MILIAFIIILGFCLHLEKESIMDEADEMDNLE
jgi:hypothetical protein